ncbi:signal peptidase II [Bacteriovoracales bacterium]|nr:signal peptidase II [Bacteriovoracales bacterium]
MKRVFYISLIGAIIILVDQFTKGVVQDSFYLGESKTIIEGLFNLTYVTNKGAAFGMGASSPDWLRAILFLYLPVAACFYLLYLVWVSRNQKNWIPCWAYGLIFAGAVGNLIDRFMLDYVVDFLDFYIKDSHFPAFNVADSAISIAAGLLIIDLILDYKRGSLEKDKVSS